MEQEKSHQQKSNNEKYRTKRNSEQEHEVKRYDADELWTKYKRNSQLMKHGTDINIKQEIQNQKHKIMTELSALFYK